MYLNGGGFKVKRRRSPCHLSRTLSKTRQKRDDARVQVVSNADLSRRRKETKIQARLVAQNTFEAVANEMTSFTQSK